jgi:hypothetical protein
MNLKFSLGMNKKRISVARIVLLLLLVSCFLRIPAQTVIPNAGFESWIDQGNYEEPEYWDTPNDETVFFPFYTAVVMKSTDHQAGTYSAKLVTQNVFPFGNVPGFLTLGNLDIDLAGLTYSLTGGVPITDMPTHLMGYYKFFPQGGDSCSIGLLLTRFNMGVTDTIGYGYFSTHDTVADWTHFSAWIVYDTVIQPDTMNVMAISSAEETTLSEGTTLYVDELYLDYTLGWDENDPEAGISVYQDRETARLIVFLEFPDPESVSLQLYNILGQKMAEIPASVMTNGRRVMEYGSMPGGLYILTVIHDGRSFSRKFFLNL